MELQETLSALREADNAFKEADLLYSDIGSAIVKALT
jgi:hypothetical protein